MKKTLIKALKISGITLGSIIALLFLLPFLFPNFVSSKIKGWAAHAITGEMNFSKARLSFFTHFPSLTLSLYDFSLKGSAPFRDDTLVSAKEVALGVNLSSIFSKSININEIYLTRGTIHVLVNEKGQANYNVYQSDTTQAESPDSDTSGASLKISKIKITQTDIVYDDRSIPLLITANGVNYLGKGDLSQDIFDLYSSINVNYFDLDYNRQHYIGSKTLAADLITHINTKSLSFIFEKNDLKINSLPVQLKGRFDFVKEGYVMDFRLTSNATDLHNIFTALPPEYLGWLDKTTMKGTAEMDAALTGTYDSKANKMPDLSFNMTVRNGYIAYDKAPSPIRNLYLNFQSRIPGLNPDSLYVSVDSLFFNLDRDYFSSIIRWRGLNTPDIYAKVRTAIDLEKWDKAVGLAPYALKGKLTLDFLAAGKYEKKIVKKGLRTLDTVVTSIPSFSLRSSLEKGSFKYTSLPQGVDNIAFSLDGSCPDHDYHHARLSLDSLNATVLSNYIRGYLHLSYATNLAIDADLHSILHLSDIPKFYPLDSMELAGDLHTDIQAKGHYAPSAHLFPVTTATLILQNGSIKTKYYPHPIDHIQVSARVTATSGNMRALQVQLTPVSFRFEDQPFLLKADLKNFEDLRYTITSNGVLDLGRLYQVFSRKGTDVKGFIKTNLSLEGLQSDAGTGHYDRLNNSGTMEFRQVSLSSELFPQPLLIESGLFRFQQEKMWFDRFKASYGKTHFTLGGYLSNMVAYATQKDAPLGGHFELTSGLVVVDELMAFAGPGAGGPGGAGASKTGPGGVPAASLPPAAAPAGASGVIIVPGNLSLEFTANVAKVRYNGLTLDSCVGQMRLDSGKIRLQKLGFSLIDAPVVMDATYGSLSPKKAFFDYHINAQNFNIKRAYNEIKLFHDLATSASKAEGIVSLDYELSGDLDANMHPVYPTLKGGGTLSVAEVKVHGLPIFGAVSKATGKDSVNNPHLSKVAIKSTIAHNIITIERTKMRVLGFRPRFEGQVSFDGQLNLQFRLGLPPFGIIGIPMTITGTEDKPVVHLRKERKEDELKESDDDAN
jgi:AsmA protein